MRREAAWLGTTLGRFDRHELDPVLSIGSGTRDFRSTFQPWIETVVFEPLLARSIRVLHHELAAGPGIDVAGDLTERRAQERITASGVRAILCLNVLEHVDDPAGIARGLLTSVPSGGLVVVTVPHRYPYHADPIDTMYRPDPDQLAGLFPGAEVVVADSIRCESLLAHWLSKPGKTAALRKLARAVRPPAIQGPDDGSGPPRSDHPVSTLGSTARMALWSTEVSAVVVRRT